MRRALRPWRDVPESERRFILIQEQEAELIRQRQRPAPYGPYDLIWKVPVGHDLTGVLRGRNDSLRLAGSELIAYRRLPGPLAFEVFYCPLDGSDHYGGTPADLTAADHRRQESAIVWLTPQHDVARWAWVREFHRADLSRDRPMNRCYGGKLDIAAYSILLPTCEPDSSGRFHRRLWALAHCPRRSRVEGVCGWTPTTFGDCAVDPTSIVAGRESRPANPCCRVVGSVALAMQRRRENYLN